MSLVSLAEENNLPEFQFIDKETINWMVLNKPDFLVAGYNKDFIGFSRDNASRFSPLFGWFLEKKAIDAIHGIKHSLRVIANVCYLIKENNISDESVIKSSIIAASLHDLRRQNDKVDTGHGKRASEWFASKQDSVFDHFQIAPDEISVNAISAAISMHNQRYDEIVNSSEYIKNKQVVDLVKSADALDRYRLPRLKWWINNQYLSILPSAKAKLFAYKLVLESEKKFLEKGDSKEAVLSIIHTL